MGQPHVELSRWDHSRTVGRLCCGAGGQARCQVEHRNRADLTRALDRARTTLSQDSGRRSLPDGPRAGSMDVKTVFDPQARREPWLAAAWCWSARAQRGTRGAEGPGFESSCSGGGIGISRLLLIRQVETAGLRPSPRPVSAVSSARYGRLRPVLGRARARSRRRRRPTIAPRIRPAPPWNQDMRLGPAGSP